MHKLFILENDPKTEPLEILVSYIFPVLKLKCNVIYLSSKEQKFLHLDILPCLLHEDQAVTDLEKIIFTVCQLAGAEPHILKEPEIWPLAKNFIIENKDFQGKPLLDKFNTILLNKTFLISSHITLADIFAAVPTIKALKENPAPEQIKWLNVYRWAEHLLHLPHFGTILKNKGCDLKDLASVMLALKPKEEEKSKPAEGEKDKKSKEKKPKDKQPKEKAKKEPEVPPFGQLDLRVGKVIKVEKHPESTKLYLEEIDIGGEVRKIASGLQQFVKIEDLQDKHVIVFCNLKPKSMAGVMSHGMVLCAGNADHTAVELLVPPPTAKAGDIVTLEGIIRKPAEDINLSRKNNPWDKVCPEMKINENLELVCEGKVLKVGDGVIKAKTLKDAKIS